MPAKSKSGEVKEKPAEKDPLILTQSELASLSEDKKQEFRAKGGTSTPDPIN